MWYRWRSTDRARSSESTFSNLFDRERLPQEKEIYSEMYYEDWIKPYVEDALKQEVQRKSKICLIQQITMERWRNETEEIKEAVRAKLAERISQRNNKGACTPEQYHMWGYESLVTCYIYPLICIHIYTGQYKRAPRQLQMGHVFFSVVGCQDWLGIYAVDGRPRSKQG